MGLGEVRGGELSMTDLALRESRCDYAFCGVRFFRGGGSGTENVLSRWSITQADNELYPSALRPSMYRRNRSWPTSPWPKLMLLSVCWPIGLFEHVMSALVNG